VEKSVWFISKYASPPYSSGGQRGVSLAKAFVNQGHKTTVISSSANHFAVFSEPDWKKIENGFSQASFDGVTMLVHRTFAYTKTASLSRALSWIHFEWGLLRLPTKHIPAPTHIIASSLSLLSVVNAYRLARKFRAKLVFEVRDIWPLTLELELGLSRQNPLIRFLSWVEKFGYKNADVIVGTMPNLVEHVRKVSGPQPRVEIVPLGVDEDLALLLPKFVAPPEAPGKIVVGYAGSMGRTNSVDSLLDAAKALGPNKGITFEFWGGGDLLDTYRREFSDQPHIIFHGRLQRSELFSEVMRAHVLFFATDKSELWNYGQSLNKLVEYMLIGRPIVATYSGFASMIDEAQCGTFVPVDDRAGLITALLHYRDMSHSEREELGLRGRTWVTENRSYATLANHYLHILDSA